jgi:photosystem II stability/assembly factor-like uncharacterized protein
VSGRGRREQSVAVGTFATSGRAGLSRRLAGMIVAAVLLLPVLGVSLSASAGPRLSGPSLFLRPSFAQPGGMAAATGCGWEAGKPVLFLWDGGSSLSPSSTQPGEDGCFDLLLTVSEQADSGEHELTARQGSLDRLPGREPPRGEDTRAASTPFHVLEIDGELEEGLLERERKTNFLQPRLYPRSEFPADALPRARDQAGRLRPVHQAKELVSIGPVEVSRRGPVVPVDATALSAWGSLGPAPLCMDSPARGKCAFAGSPYSGRVTAIAPHPGDTATIFIGTEGGGVWRTRNGGTSWTPLFDQQPTMRIGAVAVDPFEPDRVFAGTGTDEYGAYGGLGLYVSEDGGAHWTKLGGKTLDGCSIGRIWVQTRGLILLAASVQQYGLENPPTASCEGGVYASDDGGQTWKRWLERLRVEDILVAGNKAFAGVRGEGVYVASLLQSAKPGKVHLDANWTPFLFRLPNSEVGAVRLAAAPSDASRLYVVAGAKGLLKLGWTSGNGGLSWTPINLPHAGSSFLSLAVSPQSASELYLGTNPALYRSLDGGQTYSDKNASRDHLHDDVPALAFDAANRLLIGTDGGIYRTADFQQFENLNANLSTVLVHPGISGRLSGGGPLLAGIQDGGTAKYTGSKVWLDFGHGGDGWHSAADPRSTDVLYHTTLTSVGIYKSTDGGESSSFLWHPDWQEERRHTLVMDLERPDRLYGGTCKRLWRSDDGAENWTAISPALPGCPFVSAVAPAASDADVVYFGMGSGGVMVTRDGGAQ